MSDEFQKIATGKFVISVPKKYKIKKHIYKTRTKKGFPGLPSYSPELSILKGFYIYEVKMGMHSFNFFTETDNRKPEDLAASIELQTRYLPTIQNITVNNCRGTMYGNYSEEMTWIDWWIEKDDCMICFNLQGMGIPSQDIKDDVSDIINNLECIED
jgi:hypothetical protein